MRPPTGTDGSGGYEGQAGVWGTVSTPASRPGSYLFSTWFRAVTSPASYHGPCGYRELEPGPPPSHGGSGLRTRSTDFTRASGQRTETTARRTNQRATRSRAAERNGASGRRTRTTRQRQVRAWCVSPLTLICWGPGALGSNDEYAVCDVSRTILISKGRGHRRGGTTTATARMSQFSANAIASQWTQVCWRTAVSRAACPSRGAGRFDSNLEDCTYK